MYVCMYVCMHVQYMYVHVLVNVSVPPTEKCWLNANINGWGGDGSAKYV